MIGYVRVWNQWMHGENILAALGSRWLMEGIGKVSVKEKDERMTSHRVMAG